MGITPYPNQNDAFENPSIVVSNDGQTWIEPPGISNPLEPTPGAGHNSDVCLIMGYDNKLWLIYRESTTTNYYLYAKSSTDGITWSSKVLIMSSTVATLASPTIIKENGQYVMYYNNWKTVTGQFERVTSSTITGTWSSPDTLTVSGLASGRYLWHSQVLKYGDEYHIIANTADSGGADTKLNFGTSEDGLIWDIKTNPIIDQSATGWDNTYVYRGGAVLVDEGYNKSYDLWYSAKNGSNIWKVGFTNIKFNEPYKLNTVQNGSETASFTHDAKISDIGSYALTTAGAVTLSIHNLQDGSMGTIFIDITTNPSAITVTGYVNAGVTAISGANTIVLGNAIGNTASEMTSVTYTYANNGTASQLILVYGQE